MLLSLLLPGDTREVIVTVKNNGGRDARDIRLSFEGTKNVSLVGPTVAHINTLNSWCWKEVEITVHVKEEAPNGVYPVPVTCKWRGYYFDPAKGYVATDTINVSLGISFNVIGKGVINIGDVTTDPTDIRPGNEDVEIRAFIENSGEAAAKDIEARLLCGDKFKPSWSGTDRSYIGRLNSGEKGEAIFHIDIADNIESNTYSIPLQIRYKDTKGGEYEVMREVNILVEPKPEFEIVSYYTVPANISAGDNGVKLHVKIRNTGSEKAESVSVRSTGEAEVPFDFDVKSDYVGNLKPDEEWTAVLKFDVDKDALPKAYQQGIEIRCTGDRDLGDYNVYLFDKMIPISISSNSSGTFSVPGFEVLFALIALFVVFILFLRRKR
jgi:PGF-CTERM protein